MLIQINSWDVTNPRLREQAEWFLANKTHYGSPKYLFQFLAVMVIILTLGIWGWIIVSFSTFYYGMVVIYAVIMLVIMQITRKVMRIEDLLFIRCELWLEFRILAGFFVVLGVLIIFGSAMDWDYCMFFIVEASVLAMAGMSSVATWWMLGRSKLINLSALMDKRLKQLGIENKEDEKVQHAPSLDMVLNDPEALRFFLQYLVRELSLENVFFLADVMQFKNSFVGQAKIDRTSGFSISIQELARYSYKPSRTFVQYAWDLGEAYVENISASYVTAIHSNTRSQLLHYLDALQPEKEESFQSQDWTELSNAFDAAAQEVKILLGQSWRRYVTSPYYGEFKKDSYATEAMDVTQDR